MTNERQFSVHSSAHQLDYFYRPSSTEHASETKASNDWQKTGNITDGKQRHAAKKSSIEPVLKMLDSLKMSPQAARHVLSNTNGVVLPTVSASAKLGSGNYIAFAVESSQRRSGSHNTRPAFRFGAGNALDRTQKSSQSSSLEDSGDACSESTFSQSSEMSQTSGDMRSLNTTSSDSDNHHLYQQIVQAGAERGANRFNTITVRTSNGFIIDLDVEVTKTVVMLMKIILWLRQRYPTIRVVHYREPRIPFPIRETRGRSPFAETSSDESSSSQDTIKLKPKRKRISFSPSTLLFSAVTDKSYVEAKEILETQEIDINQQTPSGQSLLHIAAGNADLKCSRLLLEHGADFNIKDSAGWGPLHSAIRRGNWKCAIMLIEAGANFGEYAQLRIHEYKEVIQRSRTCYKSMEIFV